MKKNIFIACTLLLSFVFANAQQMSGTYSVGSTDCDFTTLQSAFISLSASGVNGPVVVEIDSSYNTALELSTIYVNGIEGTSSENTVILRPSDNVANVTVAVNATNVMEIINARYFEIQGDERLTFENKSLDISAVIMIMDDPAITDNSGSIVTVNGCYLLGNENSNTYGVSFYSSYDDPDGDDYNITISNNYFLRLHKGIVAYGGVKPDYLTDCDFRVIDNFIGDKREDYLITDAGIMCDNIKKITITGNKIFSIISSEVETCYGMIFENCYTGTVNNNLILDVVNRHESGVAIGLELKNDSDNSTDIRCYNNMISHVAAATARGAVVDTDSNPDSYPQFYYNSILLTIDETYTHFGVNHSACLYIADTIVGYPIKNNILDNEFGDNAMASEERYGTAIAYNASDFPFTAITHNIFYTDELINGYTADNGTEFITYDEWCALNGDDTTCRNADPCFASSSLLKLQATNGWGTPIAEITKDYFGNIRSYSTPDIGAHEKRDNSGIENADNTAISAYYTSGDVVVSSTEMLSGDIYLFNMQGQVVGYTNVSGNRAVINARNLKSGIYVVSYFGTTKSSIKIYINK
ncbi:MAG: T9SS type A sorting domain-containing protein [Bacteroidales bacterium]|nr:T9SS type A sorting domain-containing protein [Bacteroidales bacterium]